MIRRQEMIPSYKVFSTDVFRFKGNDFGNNFLGNKVFGIESKEICGFDMVFCSTDSETYAEIARELGAEVPFLRSAEAAADTAMEEHILSDLRAKFGEFQIEEPDLVVWLRPTFVFRSKSDVERCVTLLKENKEFSSARTVVRAENRLYLLNDSILKPAFDDQGRSMIRRQEMIPSYKVFSTDVFRFKGMIS